MRLGVARHGGQFLDHMVGRRRVRIAHAEVDDVDAARARGRLRRVHLREDIGRQPFDAVEFLAHRVPRLNLLPIKRIDG